MSYYFVAKISIHDPEEYRKYVDRVDEVFSRYNGEYLAFDDHPVVVEGTFDATRMVLIRFDTRDDFNAWYYSPEYQEILKFRLRASDCNSVLVKGITGEE